METFCKVSLTPLSRTDTTQTEARRRSSSSRDSPLSTSLSRRQLSVHNTSALHLRTIVPTLTPDVLSLLVAAPGLDLDAREGLNMTPIILAAYWGVYEVIPPLVEAGADPDLQEEVGGAAAHWAAYYGYADTLQVHGTW